MKKLLWILAATVFSIDLHADMAVQLNSSEAERACHTQIQSVYATNSEIKFKARPASSYSGGVYKFWINATELSEEGRKSLGYLCEITRAGEVVQLMQKDGRWRA